MILSKNTDVEALVVKSIEGKPMNGDLLVKPLIKGDEMTLLEIHYTPGVGAPMHVHDHESLAYVVKGKVKMTVGKEVYILGPGDVCRHPQAIAHGVEGIDESVVVEIKSPAPDISKFLGV
jgi:quercetin dioxygenase-like cupin family protein